MVVLQMDNSKVTENWFSNSNFAVVSDRSDFQTLKFINKAENMPYAVMLATKEWD